MRKLLIVIDYQNDFVTGPLGSDEARAIQDRLVEKVKHFDGTVVYTKDTHGPDYADTQEGKNLPVPHCRKGEEGWMLASELETLAEETKAPVYIKETFGCIRLAEDIRELQEKEKIARIELVGVCTDICVISNALMLKAFVPEVPIVVDADCCAGVTPESHRRALEAMQACQIQIIGGDH